MRILLTILTHGDEKIGLRVAQELRKLGVDKTTLTICIANPKAFKAGKRFIDADLNRSFPGKKNGNYEEKIAYQLSPRIKAADIVIDIHSTRSLLKDAIIVSKLDKQTQKYIRVIGPRCVLYFKATKDRVLIAKAKVGLAFEYGRDNESRTLKKIVSDITRLLRYLGLVDGRIPTKKVATTYFEVVAPVVKPQGYSLLTSVKNYKFVRKGERIAKKNNRFLVSRHDFFPILFGNNTYPEYFGYRAKKIN